MGEGQNGGRYAPPEGDVDRRIPADDAFGRHVVGHAALGGHTGEVADFQVSGGSDLATQLDGTSQLGAARQTDLRCQEAPFADIAAVGDHDEVVDLGPA